MEKFFETLINDLRSNSSYAALAEKYNITIKSANNLSHIPIKKLELVCRVNDFNSLTDELLNSSAGETLRKYGITKPTKRKWLNQCSHAALHGIPEKESLALSLLIYMCNLKSQYLSDEGVFLGGVKTGISNFSLKKKTKKQRESEKIQKKLDFQKNPIKYFEKDFTDTYARIFGFEKKEESCYPIYRDFKDGMKKNLIAKKYNLLPTDKLTIDQVVTKRINRHLRLIEEDVKKYRLFEAKFNEFPEGQKKAVLKSRFNTAKESGLFEDETIIEILTYLFKIDVETIRSLNIFDENTLKNAKTFKLPSKVFEHKSISEKERENEKLLTEFRILKRQKEEEERIRNKEKDQIFKDAKKKKRLHIDKIYLPTILNPQVFKNDLSLYYLGVLHDFHKRNTSDYRIFVSFRIYEDALNFTKVKGKFLDNFEIKLYIDNYRKYLESCYKKEMNLNRQFQNLLRLEKRNLFKKRFNQIKNSYLFDLLLENYPDFEKNGIITLLSKLFNCEVSILKEFQKELSF